MTLIVQPCAYRSNHPPIDFEADCGPLPVQGALPAGLRGTLVRNGPNPLHPDPARHWFAGHGMVHRFAFTDDGVTYRNRWVRTRRWRAEHDDGALAWRGLGIAASNGLAGDDGAANTNVMMHGRRLLALEEAHLPIELDAITLATRGPIDFGGAIERAFTAHPKRDPRTGALLFFSYGGPDGLGKQIATGRIDANGRATDLYRFDAPYASMVHDFAFTARHLLFPVMPLTASAARAQAGGPAYAWEPERGAFVGLLRRDDSRALQWWRIPVCFVFHVMNAWEADKCIHMDVMQFDAPPGFPWPDGQLVADVGRARLCRWTFDLRAAERIATHTVIGDVTGEFPRIDERAAGSPYRHGWLAGHGPGADGLFTRIVHVDHAAAPRIDIHVLADGDATSEPVFVPRAANSTEGDGWLLAVVFRGAQRRSDLLVFDALDVSAGPVATISLPHRVPNGFHGNWIDARDPVCPHQ